MSIEMNALIESLLQVQQDREDKTQIMKVLNVRVENRANLQSYYAKVIISMESIVIEADDLDIGDSHFRQVHLRGFHEEGKRAIFLKLYNSQEVVLHFRTERQMARALRRIRILTGSEATSESTSSCSEEATECSTVPTSNIFNKSL